MNKIVMAESAKKIGDTSFVLWLTGLPCSGKSTLAGSISDFLIRLGVKCEQLDGDEVRSVFPMTGFSRDERNLHIRRIGYLAQILERNGVTVVASFVSPYVESRDAVREKCRNFIEIYVSTSLAECERRDVKGLYRKARCGELAMFTGVSDVYEPPPSPELVIDTTGRTIEECTAQIVHYLQDRKLIVVQ